MGSMEEIPVTLCWECTITYYTRSQLSPDWKINSTTQENYCNKTEAEINQMIREYETKGGNFTAYKLECTRKE
jgi:hypothetical protein